VTRISNEHQWISTINRYRTSSRLMLVFFFLFSLCGMRPLQAQTLTVLHSFKCPPEGCSPQSDLLRDAAGNLYGTAAQGGNGEVFKVTATGTEKILHTFTGGADGGNPRAGLIRDTTGNFYGTTYSGGASGDGIVFKLTGSTLTVLHSFSGTDGAHPAAALIRDSTGNLYGTTFYGGGDVSCSCGTIFKIDPTGTESVLYSFTGGTDGKFPAGRLLLDPAGNLYGTASQGGIVNCGRFNLSGCGVVFKLDPTDQLTTPYTFSGNSDGGQPQAGLIRDSSGNLYGTAFAAGDLNRICAQNNGCGVVFQLSPTGQQTVLHMFSNGTDGANPAGDLIRDAAGNLYGTTKLGGGGTSIGFGTLFEIQSGGGEVILHTFTGNADGGDPVAGLIRDSAGHLYGTTTAGGSATQGVVFRLTP
jgi:uncharacterized repeat protein (TIGR03803 family)